MAWSVNALVAGLPIFWAQGAVSGERSLSLLALRRWYSSLTLTSGEPSPSWFAIWPLALGLVGLLGAASWFQGPKQTISQFFDLVGHVRLMESAVQRLWRSGRLLAVIIGFTVLSWTLGQMLTFAMVGGREDLLALNRSRSLTELVLEHGLFAALTPLRDLVGTADHFLLLCLVVLLVFREASNSWSGDYVPLAHRTRVSSPRRWSGLVCFAGVLYLLYRCLSLLIGEVGLPLGGLLLVESVVVPGLMLVLDGALLGWILVELRNASQGAGGRNSLGVRPALDVFPGAALACLAALPARYVATAFLLVSLDLPTSAGDTMLGRAIRWQLSWGLADLQGIALVVTGLAGSAAWNGLTLRRTLRGYTRLLSVEGGRALALTMFATLASALWSGLAYLVVVPLPARAWVLPAADSYAHYGTLIIGLLVLAGWVELGERALAEATLVSSTIEVEEPILA